MINFFVLEQMSRIGQLIMLRDKYGKTSLERLEQKQPSWAYLLDINNLVTRERIRKQVANNVKRILFGEPGSSMPQKNAAVSSMPELIENNE